MKKISSILFVLVFLISLLATPVSAAPLAITTTPSSIPQELGQLKVCKAAGAGVQVGQLFTIKVNNTSYNVPAGPGDGGYCVLAGRFPVNTKVNIREVIPAGYFVSRIEAKPDRLLSKNLALGEAIVEIGSGVTEVIFTNKVSGSPTPTRTPTPLITSTPKPSKTPTSTPSCTPNCTPTSTPTPRGRLQICKEADGPSVNGLFTFQFAGKSKTVPVGACSSLLYVNSGNLTITEVAQAGYSVTDIYTIPPDRLISRNLNARSVTIRIVQGNAASQTIVVFKNKAKTQTATPTSTPTGTITPPTSTPTGTITPATSTPTGTITPPTPTPTGTITPATSTPTGTITPPTSTSTGTITPTFTPTGTPTATGTIVCVCTPVVAFVTANFNNVGVNASVEGMGVVAPGLRIDGLGTAVKIVAGQTPALYYAPNVVITANANGGLAAGGGFSDVKTQESGDAHLYNFTFAPGISVSNFSLHMLDFGDLNPTKSANHTVSMTAYNIGGGVVSTHTLSYTTPPEVHPSSSDLYGDLQVSGDAASALPGDPGNWTWNVSGNGIVRVVLEFGVGYDPNIAFDKLSFTYATPCDCDCTPLQAVGNFHGIGVNKPVEGMGAVAPGLRIDGLGTAVKIVAGQAPALYYAPNVVTPANANGGLATGGGFSDVTTKKAGNAHLYNFTFATGISVSNFSLHMLDFGDLNPSSSANHVVIMTAYNAGGGVVSTQTLSYTTPPEVHPSSSDKYGDLQVSGDAASALPGQPGNWTWNVSGNGIVRVVLEFGVGHDPNIAFDKLSFTTECPVTPTATFTAMPTWIPSTPTYTFTPTATP